SRRGDYLSNFLSAYPLLVSVEGYRAVHLAHHQNFFTDRDPDYLRKQSKEWTFPQRAAELLRTLLTDLTGINTWKIIQSKRMAEPSRPGKNASPPAWVRLAYYATLALVLTWAPLWGV